jgi:predicted ATPase
MATAVARYLEILRDAINHHRGVLYKTVGDGTQVAFPTAADALHAALAAQQALMREPWPDPPGSLQVRMALHAGEADPRDGDYLAAPLNRLARLLGLAHGGQILLTEAVEQLVQDDLPPGASLRDLGSIRLRDLDRAERVFAVSHPDLPYAFPTLPSVDERLRGFPATLTPFLGREALLTAITALLRTPRVRLVTLTDPGGTGKTRLGMRVGEDLANDFADGVVFVDLAPLRDPALVLPSITTVFGLRDGTRSLEDAAHAYLRERRMLLVLDNFEHLLSAAPVVTRLLAAGADVKALVTSREPLHIRGEHEYPIPPLALPTSAEMGDLAALKASEAVALFVDRAQAIRPDFRLTADSAEAVAKICSRLDGLPLAIELAAARVKVLPPAMLLSRLERRLPLLTGGTRDAPERQRTLRDAIAWSHDLLSPDDQTLFRRLGVFVGGWTLEAAEAVAQSDGDVDVLEGLTSLVDKSLVRLDERGSPPRYWMLETIREFAQEELGRDCDDEAATRQAHATYFANVAIAARSGLASGVVADVARVAADQDNLRAALDWLLAAGDVDTALRVVGGSLSEYWLGAGGHLAEGRAWLDRALSQGEHASPAARAWGLFGVTALAYHQGDMEAARSAGDACLALARETKGPVLATVAPFILHLVENLENHTNAAALAHQALDAARALGDPGTIGWALQAIADVRWNAGDPRGAVTALEESLAIFRGFGGAWGEADALTILAMVERPQGFFDQAVQHHIESLIVRRDAGQFVGSTNDVIALADIAREHGQLEAAARLLGAEETSRTRSSYEGFQLVSSLREQLWQALTEHLGEERFRQALDVGRAYSTQEAIAEALAVAESLQGALSSKEP